MKMHKLRWNKDRESLRRWSSRGSKSCKTSWRPNSISLTRKSYNWTKPRSRGLECQTGRQIQIICKHLVKKTLFSMQSKNQWSGSLKRKIANRTNSWLKWRNVFLRISGSLMLSLISATTSLMGSRVKLWRWLQMYWSKCKISYFRKFRKAIQIKLVN